jgi:hypothetical protein
VAQHLTKGELVSEATQLMHVLSERSVKFEIPVRDQDHRHSCREGLGERPDGERRIPGNPVPCSVLQLTNLERHRLATVVDGKLSPGNLMFPRQDGQHVGQVI